MNSFTSKVSAGFRTTCLSPLFSLRLARRNKMSTGNPAVVFVLGGPGAGKGTQCAKIVEVSVLGVLNPVL